MNIKTIFNLFLINVKLGLNHSLLILIHKLAKGKGKNNESNYRTSRKTATESECVV